MTKADLEQFERRDRSCDFKGLLPISLKAWHGLSHKRGMFGIFVWREYKRTLPRSEKILIHLPLGVLEFVATEVNNYGYGLRPKTHISGSS